MSKQIDEEPMMLYKPIELIARGTHGLVWKVEQRKTRQILTLQKKIDAFRDSQSSFRQMYILSKLNHRNVAPLRRVLRDKNSCDLYLLFQYMQADICRCIGENVFQEVHIRYITYQLLKAVQYLQSLRVFHHDIRPKNVLINSDCLIKLKLCDLELTRSIFCEEQKKLKMNDKMGIRWYQSPQVLLSSTYSQSTDIWSIGCIIAEILIDCPLFSGSSVLQQLQKIIQFTGFPQREAIDALQCGEAGENLLKLVCVRKRELNEYFVQNNSPIVKLLVQMLQFNPNKRISVEEALQDQCLHEFRMINEQQNATCKLVLPDADETVRLSGQQYRRLIYQHIQLNYPQNSIIAELLDQKERKESVEVNVSSPPKHAKQQKCLTRIKKTHSKDQIVKKIAFESPKKSSTSKKPKGVKGNDKLHIFTLKMSKKLQLGKKVH